MGFRQTVASTIRFRLRERRPPIFHCCVQKTASQWFGRMFRDHLFWQSTRLCVSDPHRDFLWNEEGMEALLSTPKGVVVSPVYCRARLFLGSAIQPGTSVFFVKRDPRDIVVSLFFSTKYSHTRTPAIARAREELTQVSEEEGMNRMLQRHLPWISDVVVEWSRAEQATAGRIRCFKYEDLFGVRQQETFGALMQHCKLQFSEEVLSALLDKHSFESITGRAQGEEATESHFRKGIAGDWQTYFSDRDILKVDDTIPAKLQASGY